MIESLCYEEYSLNEVTRAAQSIEAGYTLPPLPTDTSCWSSEWAKVTRECVKVVERRQADHLRVGCDELDRIRHSDATIAFNLAILRRSIPKVKALHRLVLDAPEPREISPCQDLLEMVEGEGCYLTQEHLRASKTISDRLMYQKWSPEFFNGLHVLAFEDLSQLDRILILFDRGIRDIEEMRASLAEFSDIATPIMDGAL